MSVMMLMMDAAVVGAVPAVQLAKRSGQPPLIRAPISLDDRAPTFMNDPWAAKNDTGTGLPSTPDVNTPVSNPYKQPVWRACEHTSERSYVNVTYAPYPIPYNSAYNMTIQGMLADEVPSGTKLSVSRHYKYLPVPNPPVEVDICSLIAAQFPDSPRPIKCPVNQWAIQLILHAIEQKALKSPDAENALTVHEHLSIFAVPGTYTERIELRIPEVTLPVTCAETEIHVGSS